MHIEGNILEDVRGRSFVLENVCYRSASWRMYNGVCVYDGEEIMESG